MKTGIGRRSLITLACAAACFALVWAVACLAVPAPSALAAGATAGVARIGSPPAGQPLQIVLPLRANLAGLERFASAVNTVSSPEYGDYEPIAQLARRFGAPAADRARVLRYLRAAGARQAKIDRTGLFADATMAVSRAQRLFGTGLAWYQSARATRFIAPTGAARIPAALRGAVTGVVGLDTRPVFTAPEAVAGDPFSAQNIPSGYPNRSGTPSGCGGAIGQRGFTPNQYLDAYDYRTLHSAGMTGDGERVALIEIDGYRYSDLRSFASCFGFPVPAVAGYGVNLTHGLAPGGETTLDLEVLDAAAPGLKEIDVYESRARAADVLEALTAPMQNGMRVPDVISASLSTCEPALQLTIGRQGERSAEGALALAAASGISVVASSGDAGSSACVGRSGPIDALAVDYPASSPYVTGVGGTSVHLNSANQISSQIVWNDAPDNLSAGGGGLSALFGRPAYQRGFVGRRRRGVPDVSMLADVLPGYEIYCTVPECARQNFGSPWVSVGGTSAAAPLFAGGLALVDQVLRAHGKQNLGLVNPLLYDVDRHHASAHVFDDVRRSDNDLGPYLPGGHHRSLGCCLAKRGYDLASGLGSVNLARLAVVATELQPGIGKVGLSLPGQRPVARHRILARLSCSRRCIVLASATVTIAGASPFRVASGRAVLRGRGQATVSLRFSRQQLLRLRAGLRAHQAISAAAVGELIDAGGNVEAVSSVRALPIRH